MRRRFAVAVTTLIVATTAGMMLFKWLVTLHQFDKPYYNGLLIKIGMAAALPLHKCWRRKRKRTESLVVALTQSDHVGAPRSHSYKRLLFLMLLPTLTDIAVGAFDQSSLLMLPVSVWTMLDGMQLFSVAALSWLAGRRLPRPLRCSWQCVLILAITGVGLVLISVADTLSRSQPHHDNAQPRSAGTLALALLLKALAVASSSVQNVYEEWLMRRHHLLPAQAAGWEGCLGLLIYVPLAVLLTCTPGSLGPLLHEDFGVTFKALATDPCAIVISVVAPLCILAQNVAALVVTEQASAVTRAVIGSLERGALWAVTLGVYYAGASSSGSSVARAVGEPWTRWSWVQAAGFALTVAGNVLWQHWRMREVYVERERLAEGAT